jgi:hypothetical protein
MAISNNRSVDEKLGDAEGAVPPMDEGLIMCVRKDKQVCEREHLLAFTSTKNGIHYPAKDRDWSYSIVWNSLTRGYEDSGIIHAAELPLITEGVALEWNEDKTLVQFQGQDLANLCLHRWVVAALDCAEDDKHVTPALAGVEAWINAVVESGTLRGNALEFNGLEYNFECRLYETTMMSNGSMAQIGTLFSLEADPKNTTPLNRVQKARAKRIGRANRNAGRRVSNL